MSKPTPKGIPKGFFFNKSHLKKYKIPSVFLNFEVEKWNRVDELINLHQQFRHPSSPIESKEKWISDFKTVKANYPRKPEVARFAERLAEYLENEGGKKYEEDYERRKNQLEAEKIKRKQESVSSNTRKKIRLLESLKVSAKLDEELEEAESSKESEQSQVVEEITSVPVVKTIFRHGEKLHEQYTASEKLKPVERKSMSSGLSGILDLTNENNGQSSLFTVKEWQKIECHYKNKYKLAPKELPLNIKEKWEYVSAVTMSSGSLLPGRQYLDKICAIKETSLADYSLYKLLDGILDTVQNYQHILNPPNVSKITEADYTYQIWLPLLRKLLSNDIRLKTGETVSDDSTADKQNLYRDQFSNIIGFKIDIRFICDFEDEEFDLADMEVALGNESEEKIFGDKAKLAREGKLNTSTVFQIARIDHTWTVQVSGLHAQFSTLVYAGNDFFVSVSQFGITFPTSIGQLESFKEDLKNLMLFKEDIETSSRTITAKLQDIRNKSDKKAMNKMHTPSPPPSTPPPKDDAPSVMNWYTPPRDEVHFSIIPAVNKALLRDMDDQEFGDGSPVNIDNDDKSDGYDSDGFKLTDNGWYCRVTNKYLQCHPYKNREA